MTGGDDDTIGNSISEKSESGLFTSFEVYVLVNS